MDFEKISVLIDGEVNPYKISYDCSRMGAEINNLIFELQSKLKTKFWKKFALHQSKLTRINVSLIIKDEKFTRKLEVVTAQNELDIEQQLLEQIPTLTLDIGSRISYKMIISPSFIAYNKA